MIFKKMICAKAKEILKLHNHLKRLIDQDVAVYNYCMAKGYLAALEGEEVRALVEALEQCREEANLLSFTDDQAEEVLLQYYKAVKK